MNYLLDTCVISDFFKRIPSIIKHFEELSPNDIFISSLSVMEIEYGLKLNVERENKIRPLWNSLLQLIEVLPYSTGCARNTARVRAILKAAGLPIGPYDILIAGTALAHNMVMVTSNFNEFNRVNELKIENWRDPF